MHRGGIFSLSRRINVTGYEGQSSQFERGVEEASLVLNFTNNFCSGGGCWEADPEAEQSGGEGGGAGPAAQLQDLEHRAYQRQEQEEEHRAGRGGDPARDGAHQEGGRGQ